jgi:hypothetical protein
VDKADQARSQPLPTKFELVINLKPPKTLGPTIPRDFILLGDEVIE